MIFKSEIKKHILKIEDFPDNELRIKSSLFEN